MYLYTLYLVSTAYYPLGLFIFCPDKQTNILLDINWVTFRSASTITKLDWNQPSISRGWSLPCYRIAPCLILFFFYCNTRKDVTYKNTKKKRYVHYSLLIVQMLSCSQYNTYASYKFDTVYYLQHLHYLQYNTYRYLQYDTYTSYNTIFVLLTARRCFSWESVFGML